MDNGHYAKKQFYFRLFWPCLLGFLEVVQQAWHYPLGTVNPFFKLDCLLCNTAWVLKRWSDCLIGSIRAQLEIAKEAIHWLEAAHDSISCMTMRKICANSLSIKAWVWLPCSASLRTAGVTTPLAQGDAPTCFFHIHANSRRWRKFIHIVEHEGSKADALFSFFDDILGAAPQRQHTIDLNSID
jgi:hypothetical protein